MFNCLNVTEQLRGDSLLLITKSPEVPGAHSTRYAKGMKSIGFQVVVKILYVSLDDLINCVQLYFRSKLAISQKFHNRVIPYKLKFFFISSPGDPFRFY